MKEQDKELLLKDLSARVPYGVKIEGYKLPCITLNSDWLHFMYTHQEFALRRPYLRPISSMTEEEVKEYKKTCEYSENDEFFYPTFKTYDWLNEHRLDFRGLIGKGLALEATEGMYED